MLRCGPRCFVRVCGTGHDLLTATCCGNARDAQPNWYQVRGDDDGTTFVVATRRRVFRSNLTVDSIHRAQRTNRDSDDRGPPGVLVPRKVQTCSLADDYRSRGRVLGSSAGRSRRHSRAEFVEKEKLTFASCMLRSRWRDCIRSGIPNTFIIAMTSLLE